MSAELFSATFISAIIDRNVSTIAMYVGLRKAPKVKCT